MGFFLLQNSQLKDSKLRFIDAEYSKEIIIFTTHKKKIFKSAQFKCRLESQPQNITLTIRNKKIHLFGFPVSPIAHGDIHHLSEQSKINVCRPT